MIDAEDAVVSFDELLLAYAPKEEVGDDDWISGR
jgi:hypothetical protein